MHIFDSSINIWFFIDGIESLNDNPHISIWRLVLFNNDRLRPILGIGEVLQKVQITGITKLIQFSKEGYII